MVIACFSFHFCQIFFLSPCLAHCGTSSLWWVGEEDHPQYSLPTVTGVELPPPRWHLVLFTSSAWNRAFGTYSLREWGDEKCQKLPPPSVESRASNWEALRRGELLSSWPQMPGVKLPMSCRMGVIHWVMAQIPQILFLLRGSRFCWVNGSPLAVCI